MEDKERAKFRKKRQRARKRKKFRKYFLITVSIIVLAMAAFLITMKLCNPDFDLKSIIPQDKIVQTVAFVKEDVFKITTTTTTTQPTTKPTTTRPANYDYAPFSDFGFDTSMQGNQVGNLLNNTNGSVTYNSNYIYYSIANSGLYRFEPEGETNAALITGNYNFKCLNILDENIYFVDSDSHKLKRAGTTGKNAVDVADNIDFAYLYNDKIYFIGSDNSVGYIDTSDLNKTVLYSAGNDKQLKFVGISLSRVFFTEYDSTKNTYEYITVLIDDKNDRQYFMDTSNGDMIKNLQLECGYFYYYKRQADNTHDLIRQKFGSEKTVTLLEDCSLTDYPVIYANRLYYTAKSSNNIQARELNMNSLENKNMLTLFNTDDTASVGVGYGYKYVYLFGKPSSSSDYSYRGSCIYTSASTDNTIYFSSGSWHYN